MKFLMSINYKFMEFTPKDLVTLVNENSNYVDGFEIFIDSNNLNQIDYLRQLAFECKKNNFHLQVHGSNSLTIEQQKQYFIILNEISDCLGYKINVVIHPLTADSLTESIELTKEYLKQLLEVADLNKIIISLENLNDIDENDRLSKNEVIPIVMSNNDLYFTYDMGHELSDYGNLINIDESIIPIISNVHIHTMNFNYSFGFDHKPIYKNDKYWNELIKGLIFLKINNYEHGIVFEYDLYACYGNDLKEKIVSYAKSIDYVAERLK